MNEFPHIANKIDRFEYKHWEEPSITELFTLNVEKFVKKLIPFDGSPYRKDPLSMFCGEKSSIAVLGNRRELEKGKSVKHFLCHAADRTIFGQDLYSISPDILNAFLEKGNKHSRPISKN